jgi:hypothetical protein
MPKTPPPLDFDHQKGYEIPTKHKEAIRQLHDFAKVPTPVLETRYKLGNTTIRRILNYDVPERARPTRTGRPQLLSDKRLDEVIEHCSEKWANRIMNYDVLVHELKLSCTAKTLMNRLHQRGYYRCTACQKPYLTPAQVIGRLLWALAHCFWTVEWLKVLWSDEVTFLIGGRTAKEKVTRKRGERTHPTCIQHQLHRGGTIPVNAWGAIGYGYKSPLLFIEGTGKSGAFKQVDYLAQILKPHIQGILEAFAAVTHQLSPSAEPLFMEDGNSAHGHKSTKNCCSKWRTAHGIILMPHPSTSPDMNPIEKCWRWVKQALHRRKHQPTTEAEMRAAVTEEWEAIPQEWINKLILKQEHWVHVLLERNGWSTPN